MHYEELAQIIEAAASPGLVNRLPGNETLLELAQALRDGQGYVAIILDPDGLKFVAAEGATSQQTIHAKTLLRGMVRNMTYSGRA